MSRIIAGAAGGTPLASVPGSLTRPTTDRVKEALFSRLDAFDVHRRRAGPGPVRRIRVARGRERQQGRGNRRPGGIRRQGQRRVPAERRPHQRRRWAARPSRYTAPRWSPSSTATAGDASWDLVFLDPPYPLGGARAGRRPGKSSRRTSRRGSGGGRTVVPLARTGVAGRPGAVCREEVRRDPAVVRRAVQRPGCGPRLEAGD